MCGREQHVCLDECISEAALSATSTHKRANLEG